MTVAVVASSIATGSGNVGGDPTIAVPGAVADGHFLVAFVMSMSGAANMPTKPSGWLDGPAASPGDYRIDYKVASGEAGSWVWSTPGIASAGVVVLALSGVYTPDPFGDTDFADLTTAGNIDLPSVDATLETLFSLQMVIKATTAANTWTPPGTASEDADGGLSGALTYRYGVGHETLTAGASGTRTWDPSHTGSNRIFGAHLLLRDADAVKSAGFLSLI